MKDIKTIEIQFLTKVNKPSLKIELSSLLTRDEANTLADMIKTDSSVFSVTCYTTKGTFI